MSTGRQTRCVTLVIHRSQSRPAATHGIERPMTQTEAAEWLQMSTTKLSSMTAAGTIPHSRIGTSPRYLKSQLLEWLRERAA